MLKIVKVGGISVGAGLVVGLGVVGWMMVTRPDTEAVASTGGSVVLDASSTPTPAPDASVLKVAAPGSVAANGGGAQSLLGSGTAQGQAGNSGTSASSSTDAPAAKAAPGPSEFHQYDQYKDSATAMFGDEVVGTGAAVAAGNTVTVKYRGWTTDGNLFDENYSSTKPLFSFVEGAHKVILGWEEGLFGMKVGGKRRLIIPASQGYGAAGQPPSIPGDALLVFDVELLEVK